MEMHLAPIPVQWQTWKVLYMESVTTRVEKFAEESNMVRALAQVWQTRSKFDRMVLYSGQREMTSSHIENPKQAHVTLQLTTQETTWKPTGTAAKYIHIHVYIHPMGWNGSVMRPLIAG
eukprot:scaffold93854_cov21-Tisochrysis_lutea.AAC.2